MTHICTQHYYPNGSIHAYVTPASAMAKNEKVSFMEYDLYEDVFDTKKDADDFCRIVTETQYAILEN